MTCHWIVVADRSEAQLYEHKGPGKGLQPLATLQHPASRKPDHEVYADAPGVRRADAGAKRNTTDPTDSYQRIEAARFARQIADHLEKARQQRRFDKLVLVAEPRFLGMLREALTRPTAALVEATVAKDVTHAQPGRLEQALEAVLAV